MITESGIVVEADTSSAWIKTRRSSACESCSSKKSCGAGLGAREMTVKVRNTLNVARGDNVVIGLKTKPLIFLTFLLYVFPVVLLITGAVIGDSIGPALGLNQSLASVISGFLFFGISFFILRRKNFSGEKNDKYKPFLLRKNQP